MMPEAVAHTDLEPTMGTHRYVSVSPRNQPPLTRGEQFMSWPQLGSLNPQDRELARRGEIEGLSVQASRALNQETILQEAQRITHTSRNDDYGHPLDDYTRTARLMEIFLELPQNSISPEKAAMCMIGVKLSRQINKPKRDNMVDVAGYAWVVDEIVNEKKRRENSQIGAIKK